MIYTIYFKKKVKLKLTCSIVFLARFLLNSWYYPVFEIVIEQEKMRVFKQRAIFNLMHAVKKIKIARIFSSFIRITKTG